MTPIPHTVTAKIGIYDAEERSVRVTFTSGKVVHKRCVNAVLTEAGEYDAEATAARVEEVALGVAQKIACGAITASTEGGEAAAE